MLVRVLLVHLNVPPVQHSAILRSAHTECVYVLCVDLRTVIISLYSIHWVVFTTETDIVYCEVRTGC